MQEALEHKRSVGGNTRHSQVFLPTSWVLYRFLCAEQNRTEHSRGYFIWYINFPIHSAN